MWQRFWSVYCQSLFRRVSSECLAQRRQGDLKSFYYENFSETQRDEIRPAASVNVKTQQQLYEEESEVTGSIWAAAPPEWCCESVTASCCVGVLHMCLSLCWTSCVCHSFLWFCVNSEWFSVFMTQPDTVCWMSDGTQTDWLWIRLLYNFISLFHTEWKHKEHYNNPTPPC